MKIKCTYIKCNIYFEKYKKKRYCSYYHGQLQWVINNFKRSKKIKTKYNKTHKIEKRQYKEKIYFNSNATLINKKCFLCDSKKKLIIHHIDGNNGKHGKLLNNNARNLIVLCRKCHPKIHNRWWRKEIYAYSYSR